MYRLILNYAKVTRSRETVIQINLRQEDHGSQSLLDIWLSKNQLYMRTERIYSEREGGWKRQGGEGEEKEDELGTLGIADCAVLNSLM